MNTESDLTEIKTLLSEQMGFIQRQSNTLQQQHAALEALKRRRRSASPPEKLDRDFLDVQFQLNRVWRSQLKQALESESPEETKECVNVVLKGLETRLADLRLGDKDPKYFQFADQLRAAKKIKAAGGDSEIAEAWARYRTEAAIAAATDRAKKPFRKGGAGVVAGAGSGFVYRADPQHLQQQLQRQFEQPQLLQQPFTWSSAPQPADTFVVPTARLVGSNGSIFAPERERRRLTQCFRCHGYGHIQAECRQRPSASQAGGSTRPL
uniref:CCHC-type domain-containing protein n=1 Tax=Plectus sambesii TaxID=2011161 RepID=A0A914WN00_9BILA